MTHKRPHMPLSVKLEAALLALGMVPARVQWDHDPALGLRPRNEANTDWVPPANDARFIVPRIIEAHDVKTNGVPSIPLSGDKSKIAKVKRLDEKHAAFRDRVLTKDSSTPVTLTVDASRLKAGDSITVGKFKAKFKNVWPKRKFERRNK